jgi:Aminomethyltransferase folate-binding domain
MSTCHCILSKTKSIQLLISSTISKQGWNSHRSFAAAASSENLVKTSLYDYHKELGGDMVPFAGYELPVLYKGTNGGVMKEHLWCRTEGKASLFDVSHMGQVRVVFTNVVRFVCCFCTQDG